MKFIDLNQDKVAIVDDEDFPYLSQYNWYTYRSGNVYYANRHVYIDSKRTNLSMHREIMQQPRDMVVDHINGDGLDNRRCNLRICTNQENLCNRRTSVNNKLGYKGVVKRKDYYKSKPYQASIKKDGKMIFIGMFTTAEEAALAYNEAAIKYFGEYAKLNEIT